MIQLAETRGMLLPPIANRICIRNDIEELEDRFQKMQKNGVDFAFFITMDRVKNMHGILIIYVSIHIKF